MIVSFESKILTGAGFDVLKGTNVVFSCSAVSNPPVIEYAWNVNDIKGQTLALDNIQSSQNISCTARNEMVSSSGLIQQGHGSITKEINVVCKYYN